MLDPASEVAILYAYWVGKRVVEPPGEPSPRLPREGGVVIDVFRWAGGRMSATGKSMIVLDVQWMDPQGATRHGLYEADPDAGEIMEMPDATRP